MLHCQCVTLFGENAFFLVVVWIGCFDDILSDWEKYRK